ncbi:MAG: CHASE domain-containing protein, partial [Rhodospirillaceae bacterium]|nr:CHASE domain-containing protein [Rhodospirillaceae bacterium]
FVYSPFRMNDLMAGLLGASGETLALRIFDGEDTQPDALMFDSHRKAAPGTVDDRFRHVEAVEIANHRWTLEFRGTKQFGQSLDHNNARTMLVSGILVSALLFAVIQ